ncbi:MAG: sulfotransferase family protein [Alphaproteobacteria bacterium]
MPEIAGIRRPHVWGIGLGRTGTTSLCAALRLLGYRRVVHNPRFEQLARIDAASDNGCTIFYKYLDRRHPGSKFVLTIRDLEPWLESARYIHDTIPVGGPQADIMIMRRMMLYETVAYDRDRFAAAWERHHADVRRYFRDRPDDLLELRMMDGEGWERLCPFLGLPAPDDPFPHLHRRAP